MWKILLLEFLAELRQQKTRVLLTTFAVAWGTIAVVLLSSFGEGLRRTLVEGVLNSGDRILVVSGRVTTMEYQGLPRRRPVRLTEDDLELLRRALPNLDLIGPSYGRYTMVRAGTRSMSVYLEGVHPGHQRMRRMDPGPGGRFINAPDVESQRRVVFLGDELAATLFPDGEAVGRAVLIDDRPYTVIGVMERKVQAGWSMGPDSERAIIPASTYRTTYGDRMVRSILIRPRVAADAPAVRDDIYRVLGRVHRFDPADTRALSVWDYIEEEQMASRVMLAIQIFLAMVGGFTLLIAGVGVANIMYVAAKERTREIGIRLAMGARRRHITAQFLTESMLLSLAGGLVGLFVAGSIVLGVAAIPDKQGAAEFLANPQLSWPVGIGTVGALALIGLAAGYFPARRAAAVDPVESLRYE